MRLHELLNCLWRDVAELAGIGRDDRHHRIDHLLRGNGSGSNRLKAPHNLEQPWSAAFWKKTPMSMRTKIIAYFAAISLSICCSAYSGGRG